MLKRIKVKDLQIFKFAILYCPYVFQMVSVPWRGQHVAIDRFYRLPKRSYVRDARALDFPRPVICWAAHAQEIRGTGRRPSGSSCPPRGCQGSGCFRALVCSATLVSDRAKASCNTCSIVFFISLPSYPSIQNYFNLIRVYFKYNLFNYLKKRCFFLFIMHLFYYQVFNKNFKQISYYFMLKSNFYRILIMMMI